MISVCEDIDVKISEDKDLYLRFGNFKLKGSHYNYFEESNNIPLLIVNAVKMKNNPQKWFFEEVDIQHFKGWTSYLKKGRKIEDIELWCTCRDFLQVVPDM